MSVYETFAHAHIFLMRMPVNITIDHAIVRAGGGGGGGGWGGLDFFSL